MSAVAKVFIAFLRLGCYSFGGPIAHLGYYHRAFVQKRQWLDDAQFSQFVAIAQFLPGPTSCQTNFLIGWHRAGLWGGLAAFLGFVLPSALLMLGLAYSSPYWLEQAEVVGLLHGLKIAALVIIFQALFTLRERLCSQRWQQWLALFVLTVGLTLPGLASQIFCFLIAALVGLSNPARCHSNSTAAPVAQPLPRGIAPACFIVFLSLLLLLPLLAHTPLLQVADSFYRSGALVFGGGHVVLPLLQTELVSSGRLALDQFLLGYASAQALPGPLFTFAGFLGMLEAGLNGGLIALVAVFLPGFLLLVAILPIWQSVQQQPKARAVLDGINAAVIGFLGSALAGPVSASALLGASDALLALLGGWLLWRVGLPALLLALPLLSLLLERLF